MYFSTQVLIFDNGLLLSIRKCIFYIDKRFKLEKVLNLLRICSQYSSPRIFLITSVRRVIIINKWQAPEMWMILNCQRGLVCLMRHPTNRIILKDFVNDYLVNVTLSDNVCDCSTTQVYKSQSLGSSNTYTFTQSDD